MAAIKPFKPLDEKFPFDRQLGVAVAPLVLINLFAVLDPADEVGFLDAFKAAAEVITKQPGFISMQLHRAIGDSPTYLNYVVWNPPRRFARPSLIPSSSRNFQHILHPS